ncbi:hypothetical protein QE152_g11352 [Popillia japonica]|uniref:Uncharacterized protein n=1 Tax=Popillia japonica TaxID=7064 RepID=A0AAW1LQX0_POPJA
MRQLGAVIDVPNGVLKTKFGEIKIYWENSTVNLGPRERKIVKIPVTKNCSNTLINHQRLAPVVEIPSLITSAKDFYAIAEIANFNNHSIKVEIENPITAEIYETENNTKNEQVKYTAKQIQQMQTDNVLNKLRLNHLNKEETKVIKDLCLQYKDVCYDERTISPH